jgi:peptidoglycan/xylan/chitin deacetylase (PgdA/CDA1 family)
MKNKITIIMYHYVRPIKNSLNPNLKGLELDNFIKQLNFLKKNYTIISIERIFEYLHKKKKLPSKSCLLTFDDGYKDHIKYVLPELVKRKIKACFFPPAEAIQKNKMLDVNQIHLLLSKCNNYDEIIYDIKKILLKNNFSNIQFEKMYSKLAIQGRWDNKKIIFIKRVLQHGIEINLRKKILKFLMKKNIAKKHIKNFYMNKSDIKKLISNGMFVGSHGYSHIWLGKQTFKDQKKEIIKSLKFLNELGVNTKNWIMCYPYGSYNKDTLKILSQLNCNLAFTSQKGLASFEKSNLLKLKRFDTNDFPQN